jgi:hypothetical protein
MRLGNSTGPIFMGVKSSGAVIVVVPFENKTASTDV